MPTSRKAKVIALSLGQGLAKVIGLGTTMVMARVLVKEDLAAYRQTFLAYATVAPVLSLGIGQGMYYFLPSENERVRGRVMDGLAVLGVMGLLFALFLALGGNTILAERFSNPKVARMLLWMIPFAIITTPTMVTAQVLVAREKVMLASVFGVVRQLVIGGATLVPLLLWQDAEAPLVGNVVASIMMAIVAFSLMLKVSPGRSIVPSIRGARELLVYSIPLALAGMVGTIARQVDKLIVSMKCTPEDFALYSLAAIELPFIGFVTGSISAILLVDFRKAVAAGDRDQARRMYHLTADKSALIIFPATFFFAVSAEPFMVTMFTAQYVESVPVFLLYLLILPSRILLLGGMAALGAGRFILLQSVIGLVLNIVVSLIIVEYVGYTGAVIGTLLSLWLWAVPFSLIVIGGRLGFSVFTLLPWRTLGMKLLAAGLAAAPVLACQFYVSSWPRPLELLGNALLYGVAYGALLSLFGIASLRSIAAEIRMQISKLRNRR